MTTTPDQWTEAIIRAGYTDPRYKEDRPSFSSLAEAAGLHTTTVSRLVRGVGNPKPGVVEAVASALGVDVRIVSEWAQQSRSESQPYQPPAEVNLLTRREQDAVTELIKAIAAREDRNRDPGTTSKADTDDTTDDDQEVVPDEQQGPTMTVTRSRPYPGLARSTSRRPGPDRQGPGQA